MESVRREGRTRDIGRGREGGSGEKETGRKINGEEREGEKCGRERG